MTPSRPTLVALLACLLLPAPSLRAQAVVPIAVNGDPANRVDIAFLGDGYTAGEMPKFATDVDAALRGMLAQEPFREYQRYLNVRRIEVASTESGASHPSKSITRNTAFGAYYDCSGIARLICVDTGKVTTAAQVLPANQREMVIVLVNDTEYGGSGGSVIVASLHSQSPELVLHELGHSFGQLADEYGGPPPPSCNDTVEPAAVNVTKETSREAVKWRAWIDSSTAIPTTASTNGVPGLFQGAMYCDSGLYRPVYNSKMRSLGQSYWQVGTEQLIRRIYTFVDPIDSVAPEPATPVALAEGEPRTFSVTTPTPLTHSLSVAWYLDGQPKSSSAQYALTASGLSQGAHSLQVVVTDPTSAVRTDSQGVLAGQTTWTLTVGDVANDFTLTADRSSLTVTRGQSGTVALTVMPLAPRLAANVAFSCGGLPSGAACRFAPASVASGSATTVVTLTLTTTAAIAPATAATRGTWPPAWPPLVLAALLMAAGRHRWRRTAMAAAVLLICAAALSVGCGGGSSGGGSGNGGTPSPGTPAGTYSVVVTATAGTTSHTATVAVTVV